MTNFSSRYEDLLGASADTGTQKTTSVVAQAVNKELNNPNGSDARAAYAGTPGESSPGHPWTSVDQSNLRTGDVVQWADRTGLVVVTDSGLNVIINGQIVSLDPNNPPNDGHGGYGEFEGFFHPTGVDSNVAADFTTTILPAAAGGTTPLPVVRGSSCAARGRAHRFVIRKGRCGQR